MYHPSEHMIVCNEQWKIPPAPHLLMHKNISFFAVVDTMLSVGQFVEKMVQSINHNKKKKEKLHGQ